MVTEDFDAHCSRWWQNNITNSAGHEIDSHTSAGYKQIIDKPTHIVNNSMSSIDLLFCAIYNQSTISNYGVDVSIFDKCHYHIIFVKVNISVPLPPVYREVWSKAFENLSVDGKVKHLNEALLNIFRNYISNKKIRLMIMIMINDNIKSSLKQRSKLTKIYYKNDMRKSDHIKVLEKSTECTKKILEAVYLK